MKNISLSCPGPRCRSCEWRESPRRFPLLDYRQPNDFSSLGNAHREKGDGNQRRSIRDISGEFSESEKRWSFVIELFLFGVIAATTIAPLLDVTRALSLLGK